MEKTQEDVILKILFQKNYSQWFLTKIDNITNRWHFFASCDQFLIILKGNIFLNFIPSEKADKTHQNNLFGLKSKHMSKMMIAGKLYKRNIEKIC